MQMRPNVQTPTSRLHRQAMLIFKKNLTEEFSHQNTPFCKTTAKSKKLEHFYRFFRTCFTEFVGRVVGLTEYIRKTKHNTPPIFLYFVDDDLSCKYQYS